MYLYTSLKIGLIALVKKVGDFVDVFWLLLSVGAIFT
jgi:hypothetical protein